MSRRRPDDDARPPAPRPWLRLLVVLQLLALLGYVALHSPLMPTIARAVGVHPPDFCYFTCR